MLVGIELVADRDSRALFPRSERIIERVVATAPELGLLVYSGTGSADGTNGDLILVGPPLTTTDDEVDEIIDLCATAVEHVWRGSLRPMAGS